MTICRERGNIFKQSASRSFTSEISGLRKQYGMRGWRNWQTRTFEVRVVYPWGFESPPSHQKPVHIVCWFFFLCEGGGLEQGGGIYAASKATVRLCLACGSQPVGMSTVEAVDRKISWLFCFSGRVCTLLHISCTLYKKAMNSLHRLHSVYFAAQKREFYAKSTRVSSRRSSASICRMASRIILPVIFVATGVLFSGGSCGFAPATSCV